MNDEQAIIHIVDDNPGVLRALSRLLHACGYHCATYSSAQRFLALHDPHLPGCVVLDLAMPEVSGLDVQRALADAGGLLPIIFLSGQGDISASVRAMKQGAVDFLTKPVERDALLAAVRVALARNDANRRAREQTSEIRRRLDSLTPREYKVFEHVIRGDLNKQTAAVLGAAAKTIKIHRARVMEKMQVKSVAELVRLAEHAGIEALATMPV